LGPPAAAGRGSLGADPAASVDRRGPETAAARTARLHSLALTLLERHGVLTREAVAAEAVAGGFSAIYPILRALEDAGRIRRGYFVDGLGAAQFALGGALDRLRAFREPEDGRPRVTLLAAADPANPFGAALPWPRRDQNDRRSLQRAAGAYVVAVDGAAALYVDRGGSSLQALPAADDPAVAEAALRSLGTLLGGGRLRELVISKVDGEPIGRSPWRERLLAAGFTPGYRGLVLRGVGH
ncbi:MAG: DEAD/DEAH box helicase, partial [Candidatus Limnocylindrales bacterium]